MHLLHMLFEHLTEGIHSALVTSLESALPSHALAFLAEESRKEGAIKMPIPEIFSPSAIDRLARGAGPEAATSESRPETGGPSYVAAYQAPDPEPVD